MNLGVVWPSWRRRAAACVVDGEQLARACVRVRRRPLDWLFSRLPRQGRGAVVLLDHAHAGAADVLETLQHRCAEHFDAGAIVIGVENLPPDDDTALSAYRRATRVPVFGVDLRLPCDLLLLDEALVAARAAASLGRR